jgi:hypothetical protein
MILLQVTHWQSPHFHAYFPAASSYPAIVGEILNTGIACLGFNWVSPQWHQYCGVFKHRNAKLQRIFRQNKYTTDEEMRRNNSYRDFKTDSRIFTSYLTLLFALIALIYLQ